jgi:3-keto-5-aminohexanoate cleavage enzyme
MPDPVIISCALTGNIATPEENPNLPFSPQQIGEAAVEAWKAGAAIVHIHAREDDGTPAWEPEFFQRSIDYIREADCDVLINLTTSYGSVAEDDWNKRYAALEPRPQLASFDCGTMNFGPWVFRNAPDFLEELAKRMLDAGVKPELEIFDSGQLHTALRLADMGLLEEPLFFQFVLGIAGGAPATPASLTHLVEQVPEGAQWSICSVARHQLPMNTMALGMGGHVRTGLEDNLWFRKGEPATNGTLVERLRKLIELTEQEVASPAQTRELLGIGEGGA